MENERQSQSKIARLSFDTRMLVNANLLDQWPQAKLLTWLNGLEETKRVMAEYFEGAEISPQNLSDYKNGRDYLTWKMRQERAADLRTISRFSRDLGEATLEGKPSSAAVDLAGGHILERLETLMSAQADDDELAPVLEAIDRLRKRELDAENLKEKKLARKLKEAMLAEKKAEREDRRDRWEKEVAEHVLELARSQDIQAVVAGGGNQASQIAALRKIMFPQRKEAE